MGIQKKISFPEADWSFLHAHKGSKGFAEFVMDSVKTSVKKDAQINELKIEVAQLKEQLKPNPSDGEGKKHSEGEGSSPSPLSDPLASPSPSPIAMTAQQRANLEYREETDRKKLAYEKSLQEIKARGRGQQRSAGAKITFGSASYTGTPHAMNDPSCTCSLCQQKRIDIEKAKLALTTQPCLKHDINA